MCRTTREKLEGRGAPGFGGMEWTEGLVVVLGGAREFQIHISSVVQFIKSQLNIKY